MNLRWDRVTVAILALLLMVSLCLHLVLWLRIQALEDEVERVRSRPSIVIPGRVGAGGGMRPE